MNALSNSFYHRFREFIITNKLLSKGERVIVAVSGGVDSVTLLHLMNRLRAEWSLQLIVAHLNHQLRDRESDADEEFVSATAKNYGVECIVRKENVKEFAIAHKLSNEVAAREVRYRFFEDIRIETGAEVIATAHHANDNAETVLLNILRGTGVKGLAGIPVKRSDGNVIRPLLFATRSEIVQYAKAEELKWREDSTNVNLEYRRNYIRNRLLPLIEQEFQKGIVDVLNRLSNIVNGLVVYLDKEVSQKEKLIIQMIETGEVVLNIPDFLSESKAIKELLVLRIFEITGIETEYERVQDILNLCNLETGSSISLATCVRVFRDRDKLIFTTDTEKEVIRENVSFGYEVIKDDFRFTLSEKIPITEQPKWQKGIEIIDAEKLIPPLSLRSWQNGDWFIPLGMSEKKKVSDFYISEKVPLFKKRRIPILESDGKIVYICGFRIDDRFKVTSSTKSIVRITYDQRTNYS